MCTCCLFAACLCFAKYFLSHYKNSKKKLVYWKKITNPPYSLVSLLLLLAPPQALQCALAVTKLGKQKTRTRTMKGRRSLHFPLTNYSLTLATTARKSGSATGRTEGTGQAPRTAAERNAHTVRARIAQTA